MTETELRKIIEEINPVDREAMKQAEARLDILAKPPGSLGVLESIAIQLAGITGRVKNSINSSAVTVFAADNGVTERQSTYQGTLQESALLQTALAQIYWLQMWV